MNPISKENQRVRLTKRMLKDALIELLETTSLQSVTITEICARAEINRTTFYKYYSNECELYQDIENDFLSLLRENLQSTIEATLENLLQAIRKQSKMAKVIINNSSEVDFSRRIFSLPEITNHTIFINLGSVPHRESVLFFVFSGSYAVIKRWANTGFKQSPKELAALLQATIEKIMQ